MERSIQVSEQRLLQASVDLRNQMAEIHKLRAAIQSAEASRRCLTDPKAAVRTGTHEHRRSAPRSAPPSCRAFGQEASSSQGAERRLGFG